jgi:hypothetical protein
MKLGAKGEPTSGPQHEWPQRLGASSMFPKIQHLCTHQSRHEKGIAIMLAIDLSENRINYG